MGVDQIGKYQILGLLGQGAMGEVHEAFDPVLNRRVAIKTITPTLVLDETFKKRFQREAQSAALLSHPNIVTIYELGEDKGVVYLVMELLRGTDLKVLIARRAASSLEEKLLIVEQICEGLSFAHDKGVIHRDLKPANVHVLPSRAVKIMDFGLARLSASDLTRAGTIMGTPTYMSPEQVRAEKVDARSDLFSVGAVLYELLSGHKAFSAESVHATLFEVLERDPRPLRGLVPLLPKAVAAVAERALLKDPARRFATAREMKRALEAARRTAEFDVGIDLAATLARSEIPTLAGSEEVSGAMATVEGSAALDPSVRDLAATAHSEPTLAGAASTTLAGRGQGARRPWLALAAVGLVVGAIGYWVSGVMGRPSPPGAAAHGQAELGRIEQAWVASRLALAQMSLESRDYSAAVEEAERILTREPASLEAREFLEEGRRVLGELEAAAAEAREAFHRDDRARASEALKQVLAIDPRHPVVAEVGPALDQYFREGAENARRVASRAQRAAQGLVGKGPFAAATGLAREAEGLFAEGRFAQATQKFLEAGGGFDRVRREAEASITTARAATAVVPPVPTPPSGGLGPPPATTPAPPPATLPSVATVSPPLVPSASTISPVPAPAAPSAASPSSPLPPPNSELAVREVIADYARALATRDLGLFKSVMPGLSRERERLVRESFRDVRSLRVALAVQSVEVSGSRAVARVARRDTLDGKTQPSLQLRFNLAQRDGIWVIEAIE